MTYKEFIQNILDTRGRFNVDGYKERHHIIPECCGGPTEKWNLIDLTAQEHYEAHRLLAEENPDNWGLQTAWWSFCIRKASSNTLEIFISADEYAAAKIAFSSSQKLRMQELWKNGLPWSIGHWVGLNPRSWGAGMKKGFKDSDETKKRKSLAAKSENNPMYGKKHSQETLSKISATLSDGRLAGENNPRYGQHWVDSPETKIKKSIVTKGGNNPRAIRVKCLETGEAFDCIKFANEKYKIGKGLINKCCKGLLETAGGYHWEYVEKNEEGDNI